MTMLMDLPFFNGLSWGKDKLLLYSFINNRRNLFVMTKEANLFYIQEHQHELSSSQQKIKERGKRKNEVTDETK